jgi:hypothetical protein
LDEGRKSAAAEECENPPHQPRVSKNRSLNGRVEMANSRNFPSWQEYRFEAEEENVSSADD